jgi:hypothetical protein
LRGVGAVATVHDLGADSIPGLKRVVAGFAIRRLSSDSKTLNELPNMTNSSPRATSKLPVDPSASSTVAVTSDGNPT